MTNIRNAHNASPVEMPRVSPVGGGPVAHASDAFAPVQPVQGGFHAPSARNQPKLMNFVPAPGTEDEQAEPVVQAPVRVGRTAPVVQFVPAEEPVVTASAPATVSEAVSANVSEGGVQSSADLAKIDPSTAPLSEVRAVLLAVPALADQAGKIRNGTRANLLKMWSANFSA